MTWADVPQLVQLCYDEYGSYTSSSSSSSSSSNRLQNWTDKWEDAALRPYVWATLVLKVGLPSTRRLPPDHAILVASLSLPTESRSNNGNHNNGNSDDGSPRSERLVGMAEVSRQPALPDRNPPPWPIPLVLKEAYCRLALGNSNASSNDPNRRTTQGWLTNLLVVPAHRGRGWSKVLVQACEGVARAWGRSSLHLHCHATATTPQALYRSLDYRPPSEEATTSNTKEDSAYAWMNTGAAENVVAPWQSSIYMLEGVPLLYMCKSLVLDAD
jgi:GNAT superfamily N-acetyltransferase